MTEWKMKRFWDAATVEAVDTGFTILLDGRSVKTPAKAPLIVPTQGVAEKIAAEWDAQSGDVKPESMPFTRAANAAIDKVTHQFDEVATLIAAYGETDLLCYRAERPQELIERQAAAWDPILDWAATTFGARLIAAHGVMHIPQSSDATTRLSQSVHALTPFQLTAFHDLVSLTGSLVLGFAIARGHIDADSAWHLSRIDETWQIEQWGSDEEAEAHAKIKHTSLVNAAEFFDKCA